MAIVADTGPKDGRVALCRADGVEASIHSLECVHVCVRSLPSNAAATRTYAWHACVTKRVGSSKRSSLEFVFECCLADLGRRRTIGWKETCKPGDFAKRCCMCSGTSSQSPLLKKINPIKTCHLERECTAQARCAWVGTCDGDAQMTNKVGRRDQLCRQFGTHSLSASQMGQVQTKGHGRR